MIIQKFEFTCLTKKKKNRIKIRFHLENRVIILIEYRNYFEQTTLNHRMNDYINDWFNENSSWQDFSLVLIFDKNLW